MEYTGFATLYWYLANTRRAQRGLFYVPQQDVLLISLYDTKYTAWINVYRLLLLVVHVKAPLLLL